MFFVGLFIFCFSLPVSVTIFNNYVLDLFIYGIFYPSGVAAWLFSVLLLIIGAALMIVSGIRRRKKDVADATVNLQRRNHCSTCNIDVAQHETKCPVCGKQLK